MTPSIQTKGQLPETGRVVPRSEVGAGFYGDPLHYLTRETGKSIVRGSYINPPSRVLSTHPSIQPFKGTSLSPFLPSATNGPL